MTAHPHSVRLRHLAALMTELEVTGGISADIEPWVAPIVGQALAADLPDVAMRELQRQSTLLQALTKRVSKAKLIALLGGINPPGGSTEPRKSA